MLEHISSDYMSDSVSISESHTRLVLDNQTHRRQNSAGIPSQLVKNNSLPLTAPPQILIVDDNAFNVQTLQILMKIKYNIECAYSMDGQSAIRLVKSFLQGNTGLPFKLILMDCHMNDMDGF